jgi:hypothetical protein
MSRWFKFTQQSTSDRNGKRAHRRFAPVRLEALEDRLAPAALALREDGGRMNKDTSGVVRRHQHAPCPPCPSASSNPFRPGQPMPKNSGLISKLSRTCSRSCPARTQPASPAASGERWRSVV